MANVTSSMIGVNLNQVTAGTDHSGTGAPYPLGTIVTADNGGQYMMVQAAAAISTTVKQQYALAISSAFQAAKITKALAVKGYIIGIAPSQIIADEGIFWACIRGVTSLRVSVSCAADTNLWTTATGGLLDDTSGGSHVVVLGIKITAAASASTSEGNTVRTAIVTNTLVPQLIA